MKYMPRSPKKMISILVQEDLLDLLRSHCKKQDTTVTMFIMESVIYKLELEAGIKYTKVQK